MMLAMGVEAYQTSWGCLATLCAGCGSFLGGLLSEAEGILHDDMPFRAGVELTGVVMALETILTLLSCKARGEVTWPEVGKATTPLWLRSLLFIGFLM